MVLYKIKNNLRSKASSNIKTVCSSSAIYKHDPGDGNGQMVTWGSEKPRSPDLYDSISVSFFLIPAYMMNIIGKMNIKKMLHSP